MVMGEFSLVTGLLLIIFAHMPLHGNASEELIESDMATEADKSFLSRTWFQSSDGGWYRAARTDCCNSKLGSSNYLSFNHFLQIFPFLTAIQSI